MEQDDIENMMTSVLKILPKISDLHQKINRDDSTFRKKKEEQFNCNRYQY